MAFNGILGTSVTWADFEANLRAALRTEARLGPRKSVQDIGDGNSFASCCGLFTCEWVGVGETENLPATVVLKIPSSAPLRKLNESLPDGEKMFYEDELIELECNLKKMHNTEVAVYEFMSEFEELSMPLKYYGKSVTAEEIGHICIEYKSNTRTMQLHEKHSVEQLRQIARALGKIQACSLKKKPIDPNLHNDFFEILTQAWSLETFRGMFKGILAVDNSVKTRELIEKIDALLPAYHSAKLGARVLDQIEFQKVLVNGDLHTSNVLIDKDNGDPVSLIDWQCAHLGVGVEDLHTIAMTSLTSVERRAYMPVLIGELYDSMVASLGAAEPPYSLEKLMVLSDLIFVPAALFLVGAGLIPMITKMVNDPEISNEEKTTRIEVMLDKLIGCLEDVLEYDEKNKFHIHNLHVAF